MRATPSARASAATRSCCRSHTAASSKRSGFASRPSAWLRPRPPQPASTARYLAFTPAPYATATTLEPLACGPWSRRSASAFSDVTVDLYKGESRDRGPLKVRPIAGWVSIPCRSSLVQTLCCAVHSAVGCSITLKWSIRRRWLASRSIRRPEGSRGLELLWSQFVLPHTLAMIGLSGLHEAEEPVL